MEAFSYCADEAISLNTKRFTMYNKQSANSPPQASPNVFSSIDALPMNVIDQQDGTVLISAQ